MDIDNEIREQIRTLLSARGMNPDFLSQVFYALDDPDEPITVADLHRICNAFGITLAHFFSASGNLFDCKYESRVEIE